MSAMFYGVFEQELKRAGLKGRFIAGTCESLQYGIDFSDLLVSYAGRVMLFRVIRNKVPITFNNDFVDYLFDGQIEEVYSVPDVKKFIQEKSKEKGYFNETLLTKELNAMTQNQRNDMKNQMLFSDLFTEIETKVYSIPKLFQLSIGGHKLSAFTEKQNSNSETINVKFSITIDNRLFHLATFSLRFWPAVNSSFFIQKDKTQYIEEMVINHLNVLLDDKEFNDWLIFHE